MQIVLDHDRIFGALGDATRRDIVRRAFDGEEGVAELAAHYPMSFAAVQKHVAVLERAGLVSKHRSGRRKLVRTNLEALRVARRLLDRYEELWRERVERMSQLISESPKEAEDQPRGFWDVEEVQPPHRGVMSRCATSFDSPSVVFSDNRMRFPLHE
jgi:DNA-binding transcriptional ArsR family regulator